MSSHACKTHTENDEGLLGRVGLGLVARSSVLVDGVAGVDKASNGREVGCSPCPAEDTEAALLGLDDVGV